MDPVTQVPDRLASWVHPDIAAGERRLREQLRPLQEICARHEAVYREGQELKRKRNMLASYAPKHTTERTRQILELDAAERAVRDNEEAYSKLVTMTWSGGSGDWRNGVLVLIQNQGTYAPRCCHEREAVEKRLRAELDARQAGLVDRIAKLHARDRALQDLVAREDEMVRQEEALDAEMKAIQAELRAVRTARREVPAQMKAGREQWAAAAAAVGFEGKPSIDLPPLPKTQPNPDGLLPGEVRAFRYEPSLIEGINATEADIARRGVTYDPTARTRT